ncbi:PQQ-dependent sugar dehydrogenase [uncultured Phenylobacterium sp.]|uniref:PQQ-dependent sugar dehydrogenase n=1 Tax=uncultured Phenylobacterium sp. TaxID=349273 RepID=UPI0025FCAC44|nr:PQQ-dependent sugar dehydrogenase [uncultured Phenylobacterium sp.]
MADIDGTSARDTLNGTAGADVLTGRDGSDSVFGGAADDVIYGHSTADLTAGSSTISALRVASGLSGPLYAASPPGDPDRLFIVEQHTGRIRILDLNSGQLNGDHFLDLPDSSLAGGGEQGLLGLAFHPNYAANGLFYVNLTNAAGDTEIREYRRADANHSEATGRVILGYDQPFTNHNGGWMGFGPDGMLYIASGDGGSGGDPMGNAQNVNSLLGKILRIDVNSDAFPADAARNYAIPAGNPFAGATPGADEIWLTGLRNPWRASFDSANGNLWIGDVGQGAREEVDVAPAGQGGINFGWDFREGFLPFEGAAPGGLTDPILDYNRSTPGFSGFSVTGGYVYHGPGGANGLYVFGDFGTANLWTVSYAPGGTAQDFMNRNAQLALTGGGDFDQLASFAVDGSGRLYVIGLDGDIHRLTPGATAGDGLDYLRGEEGDDVIYGGFGFDDVHGNMGNDTVSGGDGGDWVVGGKDNDSLSGDAGDDIVFGNLGNDTGDGGAGADLVRGGQGADVLRGGDGADFISGDLGDDTLTGGLGADIFNSFGDAGLDRVTDFNRGEGDRVRLDAGSSFTASQQGADAVVEVAGGARVVLVGVTLSGLDPAWIFVG